MSCLGEIRLFYLLANFLRQGVNLFRLCFVADNQELLPAPPAGHRFFCPDLLLDDSGKGFEGLISRRMPALIVDIFEIINIHKQQRSMLFLFLHAFNGVGKFRFHAPVIKQSRQGICQGQMLIFLQGAEQFHEILMDILHHEHKAVILLVGGFHPAENQFHPDIFSLKILHQAVERRSLSGIKIPFQIFGIRPFQEKRLIIRIDHVHDHLAPAAVGYFSMNGFIRYFGHAQAAGCIPHQIEEHGKQKAVLDGIHLRTGLKFLLVFAVVQLIQQDNIPVLRNRINRHLCNSRMM